MASFKRYFKSWGTFRTLLWVICGELYKIKLHKFGRGVTFGKNANISYKARFDTARPQGIFIGENTWVLAYTLILAHDHCRIFKGITTVGDNCVIGMNATILPGVTIGNEVVIGAGSVVTKDIPSNSIAVGNPARVIRTDVHVYNGIITDNGRKI